MVDDAPADGGAPISVLTKSGAIMMYLAEKAGLQPGNSPTGAESEAGASGGGPDMRSRIWLSGEPRFIPVGPDFPTLVGGEENGL